MAPRVVKVTDHRSRIAEYGIPVTGFCVVLLLLPLAGCGSSGKSATGTVPRGAARIVVTSPAMRDGGTPPLRFTGVPAHAVELAVLVDDPDAPGGTFVHWTVWGLPPSTRGIQSSSLPAGAREGSNSAGASGYTPPCPPKGNPPHRYVFGVYALSRRIGLAAGAGPDRVEPAVRAATIATGSLTARYGR
jgi:Raf kinase inhibitor-like YbhB/YbcL family protein